MAEGSDSRTEAPTPRRRQEARERGQVAKSGDLTSAVVLLGGLLSLGTFGASATRLLHDYSEHVLRATNADDWLEADPMAALLGAGRTLGLAVGPVLAALFALALAANFLQVGFLATTHTLSPSLDKLNPLSGFARIFSARTFVQFAFSLLKLLLVGWLAAALLRGRVGEVMTAIGLSGATQLAWMARATYEFGVNVALALFVLALLDYIWQRFRFERDLRMTKEEVREELRSMEGDPMLKQRRRQLQMKLALQRLQRDVPKADVVVTNPTHLAVAIAYDSAAMAAPRVVAKGADFLASRIREIAVEHGIPIVERKPLAQALYKAVEVGQEIPATFYKAVAEILAYVYELARRQGRRRPAMAGGR